MSWNNQSLSALCTAIEAVCPEFGCHVAMTGGCLYKPGDRKDADILFYRIRQRKTIDLDGLWARLKQIGIVKKSGWGWCYKLEFEGKPIDCFIPEEKLVTTSEAPTKNPDGTSGEQPFDLPEVAIGMVGT